MLLNNILKVSFALVVALTVYTLTNALDKYNGMWGLGIEFRIVIYFVVALLLAYLMFKLSEGMINKFSKVLNGLEVFVQSMSPYELVISSLGLIVGLIVANLVTIPINKLSVVGIPISIMANAMFGSLGLYLASGKKSELVRDIFRGKSMSADNGVMVVDTSVLIDGRVVDIIRSGFLCGELVVPQSVLVELRHIADSEDQLKRNRGRRGLDVLNMIQKELNFPVKIDNEEKPSDSEVDSDVLRTAERHKGKVLTTDYNLNKVASVRNISVLNINELANALKPIALPGERMDVQVIKDGKEDGQGIGYMEDGTMIVVDGGKCHMGQTISVIVTSVLQTSAGRMVFAKHKTPAEKVM
ncbi:MAG: TRAM domain-containing protein [Eubacteriales bacterium]|nr:TRAM domain-containing protein [Eubacteriales bacterium]